jgi:hypothetical protein
MNHGAPHVNVTGTGFVVVVFVVVLTAVFTAVVVAIIAAVVVIAVGCFYSSYLAMLIC